MPPIVRQALDSGMLSFARSQLLAPVIDSADNVMVDFPFASLPTQVVPLPLSVSFAVKFSPLFPSLISNNA